MHVLFVHLLALLSFTSPLSSCNRSGGSASPSGTIYTVSQTTGSNRDSINQTVSGTRRNAITTAVAKASPAVVGINVTAEVTQRVSPFGDPFFDQFFREFGGGMVRKVPVAALGSGFIISSDGYILTNDHVAGSATKIIVTTTDGKQYDAKLIGTDRNADVSLLKINGSNLPYLQLGNSDDLAVGEWAIAMGNPFGLFDINDKPTVTVGVVSNTGVNLGLQDGRNYRGMIQTDAAISSGNSGGPLLNSNGEVIGINAVIQSTATSQMGAGSIGLGFAIPVNRVKTVVNNIKNGVKIDRNIADPGFHVTDITDEVKDYFKLTSSQGVVVTDLRRGSPAAEAGLQPGDVIVGVNNESVRSADALESIIADHAVGDVLTLHIQREGRNMDVKLKLTGR